MTKQNYTHIEVLLDASGSMQKTKTDVIGGFNSFLQEQKRVPGECTVSLTQFNDKAKTIFSDVPLQHVASLTDEAYTCSGWTSLNDCFAKVINNLGQKLAAKPEHERPSKVVVLVLTDGKENTSTEYGGALGLKLVRDMVIHQREKYSWDFCFVGANIDAFETAGGYGISPTMAINYVSTSIGTTNAFKAVSRGMTAARITSSVGGKLDSFFENEANKNVVSDASLDNSDISATINKYLTDVTKAGTSSGNVPGGVK